jgi:hypothetical protein
MDQWWNNSDRGKQQYAEKILSQCHFVIHKIHMEYPEIISGPA